LIRTWGLGRRGRLCYALGYRLAVPIVAAGAEVVAPMLIRRAVAAMNLTPADANEEFRRVFGIRDVDHGIAAASERCFADALAQGRLTHLAGFRIALPFHFLPLDGAVGRIFILHAATQSLIEVSAVDARNDDGGGRIDGADDELLLLLVVANETGDGRVVGRARAAVGVAEALLVGRAVLHKSPGAVGQRMRHARLFLRVEKRVDAANQFLLFDDFGISDLLVRSLRSADDALEISVGDGGMAKVEFFLANFHIRLHGPRRHLGGAIIPIQILVNIKIDGRRGRKIKS